MQALELFLSDIEKRAFRIAQLAVRNEADALDIVQDAMIKLSCRYGSNPEAEWKPLFYKILENRILDHHRKENTRRKWFFWKTTDDDEEVAVNAEAADEGQDPLQQLQRVELSDGLLREVEQLPVKQQQCFLLRCWEGMSVKETALAMQITEGSVKTHYFRAIQKLQTVIGEYD